MGGAAAAVLPSMAANFKVALAVFSVAVRAALF
jgi:hypothetical protein